MEGQKNMLRRFARSLVNSLLLHRLPGPFLHESGRCWSANVLGICQRAGRGFSPLALYEDGFALRPTQAPMDEVREIGFGAFCHKADRVCFSTSDNTDPNENGRCYQFSLSPWLYRRRVGRFSANGDQQARPSTYRKRGDNPEQIRSDVAYALGLGRRYLEQIRRLFPSFAGKTVLEVGPGINCGCALFLAAHGLRPLVADRFLAPWQEAYHTAFYSTMANELARHEPTADLRPFRTVVEVGGYPDAVLGRFETPLERLPVTSNSVDVVISHAVVEHLYDLERAFAQLQRVTRPGGYGLHQVDHRDHRDFSRPLEYLLLSDAEFRREFSRSLGEMGNRSRPKEVAAIFRQAGFDVLDFQGDVFSDPDYLRRLLPRLRAATASRYRDWATDELHAVSGFFRVRKPEAGEYSA